MAEFIRAKIADIKVGERVRPVDEEHALAFAASMAERGQISPITVRKTPAANKGKTPLTLVAGAHRLRAAQLNQWTEIDAIIVAADAVDAQLIELSENLYRNELSALDRAIFVMKYRELWEEKNGKIGRGGNTFVTDTKESKGTECPSVFTPGRELSKMVQERLGFGETTYKKVTRIGQNLHPDLRSALRGTGGEYDQGLLLTLAKKGPSEQAAIATTLRETGDLKRTVKMLKGDKPKVDPQDDIFNKVKALLAKADDNTLVRVLQHIGDMRDMSFLEAAE